MSQARKSKAFGRAFRAGIVYFVGVFTLGFLFGGIRLMLLQPRLGELLSVVIEVPVMLFFCWIICIRAILLFKIPAYWPQRLCMGMVAFLLLLIAEFALFSGMSGYQPAVYLQSFATLPGAVGLGGQIAFALFPLLHISTARSKKPS